MFFANSLHVVSSLPLWQRKNVSGSHTWMLCAKWDPVNTARWNPAEPFWVWGLWKDKGMHMPGTIVWMPKILEKNVGKSNTKHISDCFCIMCAILKLALKSLEKSDPICTPACVCTCEIIHGGHSLPWQPAVMFLNSKQRQLYLSSWALLSSDEKEHLGPQASWRGVEVLSRHKSRCASAGTNH